MTAKITPSTSADIEKTDPSPAGWSRLRTGLLVATSAALGGIAVAIWNRRILAQMRQPPATDD